MSFYDAKKELLKSDLINDFCNDKYKGDFDYMIADNPFMIEAIENGILENFPEIAEKYNG